MGQTRLVEDVVQRFWSSIRQYLPFPLVGHATYVFVSSGILSASKLKRTKATERDSLQLPSFGGTANNYFYVNLEPTNPLICYTQE